MTKQQTYKSGTSRKLTPGWTVIPLCFLLPGLLSTNYILNYFYGKGAAALDAGWFAALESGPVSLSLPNPALISGSFFSYHISPIFVLLAAVHRYLLPLPAPVFFALTQGLWQATLGAAAALCVTRCLPGRPVVCTVLGLACAGNGIALAMLGFPHVEIAISALLMSTLVLRLCGFHGRSRWLWTCPLVLLLMVREDAGLQCAAVFGCLALYRLRNGDRRSGVGDLGTALLCACLSGAELAIQEHPFPAPPNMFAAIYSGTPPFAHVTHAFLQGRLYRLYQDRAYVWAPICLALFYAAVTRDVLPAIGSVACLPWCVLACVAISPSAGEMVSYYSFPMMIGSLWPMLGVLPAFRAEPQARWRYLWLQSGMLMLSIGLFFEWGSANHDPTPWTSMGFGWTRRIGPMEAFTDTLLAKRPTLGHFVVDDAVVSLRMAAFVPGEWRYRMVFTLAEQRSIDAIFSQPGTWTDGLTQPLAERVGLPPARSIEGTPFVFRSHLVQFGKGESNFQTDEATRSD